MSVIPCLLTALFALALFLAIHIIVWRMTRVKALMLLVGIAAGSFAVTAIAMMMGGTTLSDLWVGFCVYLFCILAYLHLYVGTCRALSARVLEELVQQNGTMTLEQLDRVYPLQWIYSSRLELLVRHGWLTEENGRYRTTTKGRFFALLIITMRRAYGITRAG